MPIFRVRKRLHRARFSTLTTPHGIVKGPFFQFVATQAAIRGMVSSEDLEAMGVQVVLANTYHLHMRPGEDVIRDAGGLHSFMQWKRALATDSGGYQVFSLGEHVSIDDDGVHFRSPHDGSTHYFTPEYTIQIQHTLGADIIMPLDVCTEFRASRREVEQAVEKTSSWAQRCKEEHERLEGSKTKDEATMSHILYGIVQGGVYPDLREKAAAAVHKIGFQGYCIGGELREGQEKKLCEIVPLTVKYLPEDCPRYLMGYGQPEDIVEAVRQGVDQFDCVLPVRNGRHGQLYYDLRQDYLVMCMNEPDRPVDARKLYTHVDITKAVYKQDYSMFSEGHPVIQRPYSKAYIRHLMHAVEPSGMRFCVLHNVWFYVQLMKSIRNCIECS